METTTQNNEKPTIYNSETRRLIQGLTRIGELDIEDFQLNYGIGRSLAKLQSRERAINKSTLALAKKHAKRDEATGEFLLHNGAYVFKSIEDCDIYSTEYDKINDCPIDEDLFMMKASVLKDVKGIKSPMMSACWELIIHDVKF